MNHLSHEKSPYLLQHAGNPVDWYPWGREAFAKAEKEDKPVFLSIGYSTCHWCHVMAHESFESDEAAGILNREYISVKVDREERPDIDAVYMSVCQAVTGSGGWPLTVMLTPDQKPFFVGTYFPKYSRYGQPGLVDLLQEIASLWKIRRTELLAAGDRLVEQIFERDEANGQPMEHILKRDGADGQPMEQFWGLGEQPSCSLQPALFDRAADLFRQSYDRQFGGFGRAPKFPVPHNLFFLMRYAIVTENTDILPIVEHTLHAMADGGIFDHIGGGFSRYSTDEKWLVPHFEKMLYDNALLAIAYLEAYQLTNDKYYEKVARRTLAYILNELTGEKGGFFCGQDADSDGVEGKYYFFTPEEITGVLGEERGREFCVAYDITDAGNFEGKSIPNRIGREEPLPESVEESRKKLSEYRKKRTVLHLDDKVILSWNAWTILAMAKAYRVLGEETYRKTAETAHAFLLNHMTDAESRLFLRWRDGEAAHAGNLDDYAVYGLALLELYEITFEPSCLQEAILRAEQMQTFFPDQKRGGYYLTASDAEKLISRPKETYDGAIPSGNSAAALLLGRLAKYTGDIRWQEASVRQNRFLAGTMGDYPYGQSLGLVALMEALYPSRELVCVSSDETLPDELANYLAGNSAFHLSVLFKTPGRATELAELVPFTKDYPIPDEGCCYYLCQNGVCGIPEKDFKKLNL